MKLTFLFDPLCAWCYGAWPALARLSRLDGAHLELAPTGLFAGERARLMDTALATFVSRNDLLVANETGQIFSEAYRSMAFDADGPIIDSEAAILGIVAVGESGTISELRALNALQKARFVEGRNTADIRVVADVLKSIGFWASSDLLLAADRSLHDSYERRLVEAQGLMAHFEIRSVPALVIEGNSGAKLIYGRALYGDFRALSSQIAQIAAFPFPTNASRDNDLALH